MAGWLLSLRCTRAEAEALSDEVPALDALADPPVIVTREIDETADIWQLDCYFGERPSAATVKLVQAEVPSARRAKPDLTPLPDDDWVTLSQQGLEPVHAGRFYVHTADNRGAVPPEARALQIDAGLAFGTGGHDTTAGCLAMLDRLARTGKRFANIADIGSGTGLLAFAALHLWPGARMLASDIDLVSVDVLCANARLNGFLVGRARGQVTGIAAPGTNHPAIRHRAPYDLLIANILAEPLITLAPDFAAATAPGSYVILAGLIAPQEPAEVLVDEVVEGVARGVAVEMNAQWGCIEFMQEGSTEAADLRIIPAPGLQYLCARSGRNRTRTDVQPRSGVRRSCLCSSTT
ncbi:MAG: 50S ribosomal protein L11 methyltransferase, partial [Sphingopyxis sp.]|nr:50S ribosomal protein L11 methyltransferase [Sphingopyxis sp.]